MKEKQRELDFQNEYFTSDHVVKKARQADEVAAKFFLQDSRSPVDKTWKPDKCRFNRQVTSLIESNHVPFKSEYKINK